VFNTEENGYRVKPGMTFFRRDDII